MGFDLLSRFRKRSADDPPPVASWSVFAFGKLPVYKDFISAGLTDDASREFRDWLSNGFSRYWSSREEYRAMEIPLHAFLLRLPVSRKVAVGALWGSRDQGGLRKFPFAIFSVLASGRPETSALTALDYLPVFEGRAREIRRKYEAGGSLADVYQELRGARIEIPVRTPEQIRARLEESLSTPRIGPLARALFGEEATERWPALLTGLDGAARRAGDGTGAFRVPLADEPAPLRQLQLWTLRMTGASPAGTGPSGVLYRTGGEVPCGVVFYRDLRPEDILLLHPAAAPTDFVEEIPSPVRREIPKPPLESDEALPVPVSPAPPAFEQAPAAPAPPPAPQPPPEAAPPATEPAPAPPEGREKPASTNEAAPEPKPAAGETPEPPATAAPAIPAAEAGPPADVPAASDVPLPAAASPATESPDLAPSQPSAPPAEPSPPAEPDGWDLPLATLLKGD